jgi:hypothetical protein
LSGSCLLEPVECGPEVVTLVLETIEPVLPVHSHARLHLVCQRHAPLRVPRAQLTRVARALQSLRGVLSDRLQHPVAASGIGGGEANEALLDQTLESVEVGAGDVLRRLERAAAGEHREAGEEPPLPRCEEVVAPVDRGSEREVTGVGIAATCEEIEAA